MNIQKCNRNYCNIIIYIVFKDNNSIMYVHGIMFSKDLVNSLLIPRNINLLVLYVCYELDYHPVIRNMTQKMQMC